MARPNRPSADALTTAHSALVAARVAAGASLIAAVVAVIGSILTVTLTTQAASQQSEDEFLHAQRQTLYARVITDRVKLSDSIAAFLQPDADKTGFQDQTNTYVKANGAYVQDFRLAQVIASPDTVASMQKSIAAYERLRRWQLEPEAIAA